MTKMSQRRLMCLLTMLACLIAATSLLAQDAPVDTPTEAATEVTAIPTEVPTEPTTEVPTEAPTLIETPAETATDAPTPEPVTPVVVPVETETTPATEVTAAPVQSVLAPEPALDLLARDLFQDTSGLAVADARWTLPAGWTLDPSGAVTIQAAGTAAWTGTYGDVAVMGYFTFSGASTAQISVRESTAGVYTVSLQDTGLVTLEKRDSTGTAILGTANAPFSTTARELRLSVIGGVLRVSVDTVELIAVQDAAPLPAGGVSVGALFPVVDGTTVSSTLLFDNFFLWLPAGAIPATEVTAAPTEATAAPTDVTEVSTEAAPVVGAKSTILRTAPRVIGVMSTGNDNFASRFSAGAVPYGTTGNTLGNSKEVSEPTPLCGFNITNTAWYEFTPPTGGTATESFLITTQGSDFDTILAVYTDSNGGAINLGDLTPVANGCSDDVTGSLQARLTLPLNDNTTYYIQLGGYNGSVGNLSLAIARPTGLTVPAVPAISLTNGSAPTAPIANGGKTNQLQPVVAWNAGAGVVPFAYEVQVSTNALFSGVPVASQIVTEPTRFYQLPTLTSPTSGQVYYWHVRARNVLGQASAYSPAYSFTLDTVTPAAPTLSLPAADAVVSTLRPTFTWAAVTGASSYRVRVASNDTCSTVVGAFEATVTTTSLTFATPLTQGEYWFCVEARDAAGNASDFVGEKRHFVVNLSLSPANNAIIIPIGTAITASIPFKWAAVAPGVTYTLDVSGDSTFSVFETFTTTNTSFTLTSKPYGDYYWRVSTTGNELPTDLAYHVVITRELPLAPLIEVPGSVPNLGATNSTTPLLDWKAPSNWSTLSLSILLTYEVQLSTDKTFTGAPTVTGVTNTDHIWTQTTLPPTPGTVYYWHVRALNVLGFYSPYSPTYSFTLDTVAPDSPTTLTAPANAAVVTTARPAFSWSAVTGAKNYHIQIASDAAFTDPLVAEGTPTAASFTSTTSLAQGTYFWHVASVDAAGNESAFTAARTFTVDYRTAPVSGYSVATATTAKVNFTWTPVTAAPVGTTYTIEIDNNNDGVADPAVSLPAVTAATTSANALAQGAYQYRLVVSNGFGTSAWRPFFVSAPLPSAPLAPFTPAQNSVIKDTTPTLTWTAPAQNAGSISAYEIEISTNATFTAQIPGSPFVGTNAPTFTLDNANALPATAGTTYYWRVRALTALGAGGPFSLTWIFKLDTESLNAPTTLTLPANAAVVTAARPSFTWAAVAGAKNYHIQIDDDTGFGSPIEGTPAAAAFIPTAPLAQGTYFWQVASIDPAGNESAFTPARTFTVDYRTAPIAGFNTPTATTAKVTFTWVLASGASVGTTYTIEIDNNNDGVADPAVSLPAVTTAITSANALAQGAYQYRLVVSNGLGTSDWRPFSVSSLLPGAPVAPFAPAAGAVLNNTTPTFTWKAPIVNVGNVTGYQVDISTNATFTASISGSPFNVPNVLTFTLDNADALPATAGTTYYWRVRAAGTVGQFGPYSAAQSFKLDTERPANVTTLTAPLDNVVISAARPTFSWGAAAGAARYRIEIDTENTFAAPLFITGTPPAAAFAVTTPYLSQGTYFWRVFAIDAAGNESAAPSAVRTLTVNYSLTPTPNQVIVSAAPAHVTFTWAAVPGSAANTIRVEVDNNSDFSSPERTSPVLAFNATTYKTSLVGSTPNTSALPYGKYYWRVLVTGHSPWPTALARSFSISPAPPAAPVLTAPTTTNDTTPSFTWTSVTSAAGATVTGYELQLSAAATFSPLVGGSSVSIAGGNTTMYEWTPALPETSGKIYYVRVRAVTNLGLAGTWSTARSFTLDTVAPTPAPTLTAPANNGVVNTQKPTFKWTAVATATRYEIRYGTQTDLSSAPPISVTVLSYTPGADLTPTNTYWQVRAFDKAGNASAWSVVFMVKITSMLGSSPFLWNTNDSTPTLTWTFVPWAESYHVQVSRNSTFTDIVWEDAAVSTSAAPSITVGAALPNGRYYWRVRAKAPVLSGGQYGPYSGGSSFYVDAS